MSEDLWMEAPDDLAAAGTPRRRRGRGGAGVSRFIGCPLSWFMLVFQVVRGKNELAFALYLYRLRMIRHSGTVKVSNSRLLTELGIDRYAKYRALRRMEQAGIITLKRQNSRSLEVVFQQKRGLSKNL
jgi:hypothetical protein